MNAKKIRIDNIDWIDYAGQFQPLCPKHHLRIYTIDGTEASHTLYCEKCKNPYTLPRFFWKEKRYVKDSIDAKIFKGMKIINLDDEAIPLSEDKVSSKDKKYFAKALLTKSKIGLRLVVYAGEQGKEKEKTQIFVEPDIKRLAFDQNNLHPSKVFTKLEATFEDDTKHLITKRSIKK